MKVLPVEGQTVMFFRGVPNRKIGRSFALGVRTLVDLNSSKSNRIHNLYQLRNYAHGLRA